MARRRRDLDVYREPVSIFSLSFLDVFACALGALVLILLIIFNQVTLTFDNDTLRAKIEAVESQKAAVVGDVRANAEAARAARNWDEEKPAIEARQEQLESQLEQMQAATSGYQGVTSETIDQARQAVAQVQSQTVRQREAVNNMWFGTASVSQKVRLVEVLADRFVDHGQSPPVSYPSGRRGELVEALKRVRALEYPLFVVRPEAIGMWPEFERMLEINGLLYGFEPYTSAWSNLLSSRGDR